MATIYASIGNSDDKLPQSAWAAFVSDFKQCMTSFAGQVHGVWLSASDSPYQNACIAIETELVDNLRAALAFLGRDYGQVSIAFAVVAETEFV